MPRLALAGVAALTAERLPPYHLCDGEARLKTTKVTAVSPPPPAVETASAEGGHSADCSQSPKNLFGTPICTAPSSILSKRTGINHVS